MANLANKILAVIPTWSIAERTGIELAKQSVRVHPMKRVRIVAGCGDGVLADPLDETDVGVIPISE